MSFLRRLVQRLRRPDEISKVSFCAVLVNSYILDKRLGNRYYEHPSLVDDPRPKRTVKYHGSDNMWKYVGGNRRLVVQWSSWLTHTRPDPPTLEELQADLVRQERVRMNVARLEARDHEDRLRLAASMSPPTIPPPTPPPSTPHVEAPPPSEPAFKPARPKSSPSPFPPMSSNSAEPESWTPHASVRGQHQ
ncbi:hypothetical protein B0H10DRAFT_2245036 [Mycena sp. CBHHK59/15]|nr:hypothetical protein B0H10DRAFT_2245036 [Mycena sp. CBHHK59/15]